MTRIRLLLVDDQEVFRMGLCKLFERSKTMRVVGEASSAADAVIQADRLKPDLVLMELRLPDGSGIEACRRIRSAHPHVRVLFLTSCQDQSALVESTYAGASGFLMKKIAGKELSRAVETAATGGYVVDPAITNVIMQEMRASSASAASDQEIVVFPPQQRRVLALLTEGKTNRQIASVLALSEKTVIGYIRIIYRKLRLTRRSQAAVYFAKYQLRQNSQDTSTLRLGP